VPAGHLRLSERAGHGGLLGHTARVGTYGATPGLTSPSCAGQLPRGHVCDSHWVNFCSPCAQYVVRVRGGHLGGTWPSWTTQPVCAVGLRRAVRHRRHVQRQNRRAVSAQRLQPVRRGHVQGHPVHGHVHRVPHGVYGSSTRSASSSARPRAPRAPFP
jgi:hypothetical protein